MRSSSQRADPSRVLVGLVPGFGWAAWVTVLILSLGWYLIVMARAVVPTPLVPVALASSECVILAVSVRVVRLEVVGSSRIEIRSIWPRRRVSSASASWFAVRRSWMWERLIVAEPGGQTVALLERPRQLYDGPPYDGRLVARSRSPLVWGLLADPGDVIFWLSNARES